MKLKEFLQSTPENIHGDKGLFGKDLQIINEFLNQFQEFNGKSISVIKNLEIGEPRMKKIEEGLQLECDTNPKLITLKNFDGFSWNDNIELYSIYLQGDDVIIRCTENSIVLK